MKTLPTSTAEQAQEAPSVTPPAIIYVLHSGQLFGTERMAITTLQGLQNHLPPSRAKLAHLLLAPPGPACKFARNGQLQASEFSNPIQLFSHMAQFMWAERHAKTGICVISTGVSHALFGLFLQAMLSLSQWLCLQKMASCRHLHVVHGGTDEHLSYGRKKILRHFSVQIVAVSHFVRERLIAHRVPATQIDVIENYLSADFIAACPQRAPYQPAPYQPSQACAHDEQTLKLPNIAHLICVSRLDPIKQVGVLVDALQILHSAGEARIDCKIFGRGWQESALRDRAAQARLAIQFQGFSNEIAQHMAQADLLVHTCAEEPFGLVILEAIAARVLVLVPDRGGPSTFIEDGVNGFTYRANDAAHLAHRLQQIQALPASQVQQIVNRASASLAQRFACAQRCTDYLVLMSAQASAQNLAARSAS